MKVEVMQWDDGSWHANIDEDDWFINGPFKPTEKEAKRALKELITQAYIEVCIPKKVRKYIEKYNKGVK